jgi:D-tyrosyl-tRNA(Tyr) deacylase
MRAVVQRVSSASVAVEGEVVGQIGNGLLVLLGITTDDSEKDVVYMADKVVNLRIFEDDAGKMNRSVLDAGGGVLVVSQFTLYGDCRQGRRPSFIAAARPEQAEPLYRSFVAEVRGLGVREVATGTFQAEMSVALVNDGPVTLLVDSRK